MSHPRYDVLVVGAGHGGAQAAILLRQNRFDRTIVVVGDEAGLPHERRGSPRSISGEKSFDRIMSRPTNFYRERTIDMLLSQRVSTVDPAKHEVKLSGGSTLVVGNVSPDKASLDNPEIPLKSIALAGVPN